MVSVLSKWWFLSHESQSNALKQKDFLLECWNHENSHEELPQDNTSAQTPMEGSCQLVALSSAHSHTVFEGTVEFLWPFRNRQGRWDLVLNQLEHGGRANWCSCWEWSTNQQDCQTLWTCSSCSHVCFVLIEIEVQWTQLTAKYQRERDTKSYDSSASLFSWNTWRQISEAFISLIHVVGKCN